jgi:hypothetical protein
VALPANLAGCRQWGPLGTPVLCLHLSKHTASSRARAGGRGLKAFGPCRKMVIRKPRSQAWTHPKSSSHQFWCGNFIITGQTQIILFLSPKPL